MCTLRQRLVRATVIVIAATALIAQAGPVRAQPRPGAPNLFVFVEPPGQRSMSEPESEQLQAYRADPSTAEISVVRVEISALRQADAVNLNMAPRQAVLLDKVRVEERGPQSFSYFAASSTSPDDEVIVVVDGTDVVGTIRTGGEFYRLRPLGDLQALIRVNRTKLPDDHPPEYQRLEREAPPQPRAFAFDAGGLQDPCTEYSVIVAYTPAAKTEAGAIDPLIQLAIDETNQGYLNGGVSTKIKLNHKYQTSYVESADMTTDRDRFRIKNDTFMDEVHGLRDQYAADVAILLTKSGNYCGIAAAIGATADTAFAVVGQNCATGYYSFAHEIGHLQSARHNPQADPSTTPYAYGHGYYYEPAHWRTIMAYQCPASCDRKNYWSNPNVLYGGVAMGTAATHHNARVLNETACQVANFRSGPAAAPQIQVPGNVNLGQTCVGAKSFGMLNVCNTGKDDLIVDAITSSNPRFTVTAPSAGFPVTISHDFCFPFQVVFDAAATGSQSVTLTIQSNDPDHPNTDVTIAGSGAGPDIRVTGSPDFGVVSAWGPGEKTLRVCNTGGCDLSVTSAVVACADFTLIHNPFPATVSHDSCLDLVVRFTPTRPGLRSCNLTAASNDLDSPVVSRTLTARTPGFFSLHGGLANPHGALHSVAKQGSTFNLDFVYPFRPRWAWDVRLGFSKLDGRAGHLDTDLASLSANAKFTLNPGAPVHVFLNAGLGGYHFDPGTFEGGGNLGLGLNFPVGRRFALEATYNYHSAFTASPNLEFDQIQLGLLISF